VLTKEPSVDAAAFRLSPQQEQLWRCEPDGPQLTASCRIALGDADAVAVRDALGRLVARHEILRTTFPRRQGMKLPGQVIHDRLEPAWREGAEWTEELDLVHGPVVRAALVELDGRRSLELSLPAACADARSLALLAVELRAELAASGDDPAEPLQYADYAEWRSEALAAGAPLENVEELPATPTLPFAPGEITTDRRLRSAVELDLDAVARGASACRVPEAVFVEACWHACLARVSGETHVVVGAVVDGRAQPELEGAIGPYAQMLPLATSIEEATSTVELVDRVRRARARLAEEQDGVGAAYLAETARRCRVGYSTVALAADAGVESVDATPAPFLAELVWIEDAGGRAELRVAPELAESGTAALLARTLAAIVVAAAADPDASLLDLPLVAHADEAAVFLGAASLHGVADDGVAALFERAAAAAPSADAVVASDGTLTYGELNTRVNRLAHRLRALGVGRDTAVALCMERSTHSVVGLLGAIKAGGAYLPLNFEHPAARLGHQLAEAEVRVLLTESSVRDRLPPFDGPVLVLDEDAGLEGEADTNPEPVNELDDLVYVMYTSGSTGSPKGAGITHRNLVGYTTAILDRLGLAGARGVSFGAISALSTDLGNTSIFPALLGGGTLHLVPPADALDGARFAEYLRTHPLDVLKLTPSHLRALLDATDPAAVLPQRWLVLGGETLSWQLVDRLSASNPECRILNHYGPTETTVGAMTFEVGSSTTEGATVPIGAPLAGARAYVVDGRLRPLPRGIPGELCIGGEGVARGYVHRPEETAGSFLRDPFAEGSTARLYRTGDRVRALRDGAVEFLGRVDDQVKIRGYRVEPGEVERVLAAHPSVRQSAVVAKLDADGGHELVAYVGEAAPVATEELQSFLRESLPAYMIPARFVRLHALPLTASGKIDRRALPEPGEAESVAEYVAPRTPLEEELARIWEDLLGVERVGVYDDFFALGGHSLLATQAVIRIRNSVADIPLHTLFDAPTVAALAQAIVDAELAATGEPAA
jgi:amino acid adenylation domain-containing protein